MNKIIIGGLLAVLVVIFVVTNNGSLLSNKVPPNQLLGSITQPVSAASSTIIYSIGDTYLKRDFYNKNYGKETILRVRNDGNNRILLIFSMATSSTNLKSAFLELNINANGNNWGSSGRTVSIHRLKLPWIESGATWNCANDLNTNNSTLDCPLNLWNMDDVTSSSSPIVASSTDSILISNNQTGLVRFNVTNDVLNMLSGATKNYGWLIKKDNEILDGRVDFNSRENFSSSTPRLILTY